MSRPCSKYTGHSINDGPSYRCTWKTIIITVRIDIINTEPILLKKIPGTKEEKSPSMHTYTVFGHKLFRKLVCMKPGSRHPTVLAGEPKGEKIKTSACNMA